MFKKIIIYLSSLLAFLLISSYLIAYLYQDEISQKIKEKVDENIRAQVQWKDASLHILRDFPNLTLSLSEFQIIGKEEFKQDTLANIGEFQIQIPLFSYLTNHRLQINEIYLGNAHFHFKVLKSGKANWDIMIQKASQKVENEKDESFDMSIQSYQIEEGNMYYEDQLRGFSTELNHIQHQGKGDFTKDIFTLETDTQVEQLTVSFLGKTYLSQVKTSLIAPIEMDFQQMKFQFKNIELLLNELPIAVDASIAMPDTSIGLDIRLKVPQSPFKNFLSIVPNLYSQSFENLDASGNGLLTAYLKGTMNGQSNPGFGLQLQIANGAFQYPSKKIGIKQVQVDLNIQNPDGNLDHTKIDLNKFNLVINQSPIYSNLNIQHPISDPVINTTLKGRINLAEIEQIIPLENMTIKGNLNANFHLEGAVSQFKNGKAKANGTLDLHEFVYQGTSPALMVKIPEAQVNFQAKHLQLDKFNSQIGQSDIQAKGYLDNYILYFLKNDALKGQLEIQSKLLDIDEMMSWMPKQKENPSIKQNSAIILPKNIDFTLQSKVDKIKVNGFVLDQTKGNLNIASEKINFDEFSFHMLNHATFIANGFYSNFEQKNPLANINFSIQDLDIQKAYQSFSTLRQLAPIASAAQGQMNLQFSLISNLKNDLSPELNSIQSVGDLELLNVNVSGSDVINKVAELVKFDQLKKIALQPTKIHYSITNGRLSVKPFSLQTNIAKMNISGSNGLDQSLDYQIGIVLPNNMISEGTKAGINKELGKLGIGLNVDAISKFIQPTVHIKGTFQKPILSLGINQQMSSSNAGVKDLAKAEIKSQVDKVKLEAQKQAERIKNDAKIAAEKWKEQAYLAADKLVEEAKNPLAQFAAKKLAEKLKKEADKKAQAILEEADKKAEELLK
ncbi:AsmA family protein [Aquirufa sp. ROCK2-A2]